MLVVVMICSNLVAFRDYRPETARMVVTKHVEQVGCASPSMAQDITSATGVDGGEYFRIRCIMK